MKVDVFSRKNIIERLKFGYVWIMILLYFMSLHSVAAATVITDTQMTIEDILANNITSSGYLGIGTTSPSSPLEINGTNPSITLTLNGTNSSVIKQSDAEGLAGSDLRIGLEKSTNYLIIAEKEDIDNDFGHAKNDHPSLYVYDSTGNYYTRLRGGWSISSNDPGGFIVNGYKLLFRMNNDLVSGNAFDFYSVSGAQLINTSAEQAWMYLEPKIDQGGTANYVGLLMDVTETGLGSGNNRLMDLRVNGSSKLVVDNTGQVGIGTASPSAKLDVNGSLTVNGNISMPTNFWIGNSASAPATSSLAIGDSAHATGQWSTAIGIGADAAGGGSTAIGDGADATANQATAVGRYANATGSSAVAMGNQANAKAFAVAIGLNSQATGSNTVALGNGAEAPGSESTALGSNAIAQGQGTIAVGWKSNSSGWNSVAVGVESNSTGSGTVALSYASVALADYAIAIGESSNASKQGTTALGYDTDATAPHSIAIGGKAQATGDSIGETTAIGYQANATNRRSIAIGPSSDAVARCTIAIGYQSYANDTYATAIGGDGSQATAQGATAIGGNAQAKGSSALAIQGHATGTYSTAVGPNTESTSPYAISLGSNAKATGDVVGETIAIGFQANATNRRTIAIGGAAKAISNYATAVGYSATADEDSSVAIGRNSDTTASNQLMVGSSSYNLNTFVYGNLNVSSGSDICITGGNCLSNANVSSGWTDEGSSVNLTNTSADINANTLYVDNTNGWVGINTKPVNPYDLHLKGTGMARLYLEGTDGSNRSEIYFKRGGSGFGVIGWSDTTDSLSFKHGDGGIVFRGAGDKELVRIAGNDQNGRVGINDTDPDAKLEIVNTTATYPLLMVSSTMDQDGDIFMIDNAGDVIIGGTSKRTALESGLDVHGEVAVGSVSDGVVRLFVGNTEEGSIRVDNSGGVHIESGIAGGSADPPAFTTAYFSSSRDVGIGTASPTARLDVNGSLNISNSTGKIHTPELCLNGDCQTSWPSGVAGWSTSGLYVYNNTAGVKVGIGTNSPTAKLTIDNVGSDENFSKSAIYVDNDLKYFDINGGIVFRGIGEYWATRFTSTDFMEPDGEIVGIYKEESVAGQTNDIPSASNEVIAIFRNDGTVGIGTKTPAAKLTVVNGSILASGTNGSTPTSGAGTRLMWIPEKAAFRAGYVTGNQWDDNNIGYYSVAMGYNAQATGNYSVAMGGLPSYPPLASGEGAVALGPDNVANGKYSTALGGCSVTGGDYAFAAGESKANGFASFAGGRHTIAGGDYSVALGRNMNLSSTADRSFVFGHSASIVNISAADVFIVYSAKVGIGTVSPSQDLEVNGTGNFTAGVFVNYDSHPACSSTYEGMIVYNSTSHQFLGCNSTDWTVLG